MHYVLYDEVGKRTTYTINTIKDAKNALSGSIQTMCQQNEVKLSLKNMFPKDDLHEYVNSVHRYIFTFQYEQNC